MAAYLSLTRKSDRERFTGARLIEFDALLANQFGAEPDEVHWFMNWMDTIGMTLAIAGAFNRDGFADARKYYGEQELALDLIAWIEANFDNTSY